MSTSAQATNHPQDKTERDLAQKLSKEIMSRFPYLKCKGEMMIFGTRTAPSRYPWRIKIEHRTKSYHKCTFQIRIHNNQIILAFHKRWVGISAEKIYDIKMGEVPVRDKFGHQKVLKDGTPQTRTKQLIYPRLFDLFSPVETDRFFAFIEEIFNDNTSNL